MRWSLCIVVCAVCCFAPAAAAQTTLPETSPSALHEERLSAAAQTKLREAQRALERAHFDEAARLLNEILAADELTARLRNEAWELLAIVQIAARREREARHTLETLLRRDPEHPRQISDPGPAVDAAFARARQTRPKPLVVQLRHEVERDAQKRLRLRVELLQARDAVETVHVYVGEGPATPLAHLVGHVVADKPLLFVLPPASPERRLLTLTIEAQAPSGAVLGALGDEQAPLVVSVAELPKPAVPSCPTPQKPLRREWWLWTTLGLVVSGFVVASAVTAN